MATNPPKGSGRVGAVRNRDQVYNPRNDTWTKRDGEGKSWIRKLIIPLSKG